MNSPIKVTSIGRMVEKQVRRNRAGSTLLEVLFAASLFAMGMASLMQLMQSGSQAAMRGELESLAARRCESVVSTVLTETNIDPSTLESRFNADREWEVEIKVEPKTKGLAQLTVIVQRRGVPGVGRFELTRLIPDLVNRNSANRFVSTSGTDR